MSGTIRLSTIKRNEETLLRALKAVVSELSTDEGIDIRVIGPTPLIRPSTDRGAVAPSPDDPIMASVTVTAVGEITGNKPIPDKMVKAHQRARAGHSAVVNSMKGI
ncbi:MAG: hypothetical protein ACXABY_01660 [Candidatus Thorarchaeota archaeon]|jgi:hypothetical protein